MCVAVVLHVMCLCCSCVARDVSMLQLCCTSCVDFLFAIKGVLEGSDARYMYWVGLFVRVCVCMGVAVSVCMYVHLCVGV